MSQINDVMRQFSQQRAVPASVAPDGPHCKASRCPNAGSLSGSLCYFHKQAEPAEWPRITEEIDRTWPAMRNFDVPGAVYERSLAAVAITNALKDRHAR